MAHRGFESQLGAIEDLVALGFGDLARSEMEMQLDTMLRQMPTSSFKRLPSNSEKKLLHIFASISTRWVCRSELACHARRRDYGIAGDHIMIDQIEADKAVNRDALGLCLDMCFQSAPQAKAVRSRRNYIISKIESALSMRKSPARIVSIGSGPASEVRDIVLGRFGNLCEFLCIDHSCEAVEFVRRWARECGADQRVEAVVLNPLQLISQKGGGLLENLHPDIIFSAGLFDYLNDRLATRLASSLYASLSPGGLLLFGNFVDTNQDRRYMLYARYMKWVLNWHLIHRSPLEMKAIMTAAGVPATLQRVSCEETGFNLFAEADAMRY